MYLLMHLLIKGASDVQIQDTCDMMFGTCIHNDMMPSHLLHDIMTCTTTWSQPETDDDFISAQLHFSIRNYSLIIPAFMNFTNFWSIMQTIYWAIVL